PACSARDQAASRPSPAGRSPIRGCAASASSTSAQVSSASASSPARSRSPRSRKGPRAETLDTQAAEAQQELSSSRLSSRMPASRPPARRPVQRRERRTRRPRSRVALYVATKEPTTLVGIMAPSNLIGGHCLVAGGLATGGLRYAAEIGAEVMQVFVSNPRGWALSEGKADEDARLRESGIPVYVHASYLVNFGSPNPATLENSGASIRHALRRAAEIGARGVVMHTGSAVSQPRE